MPFPEEIVVFPTMQDIAQTDGNLIKQFQESMNNSNFEEAYNILIQIPDYDKKIFTADYFNSMANTIIALEQYYLQYHSPGVVVSANQPPLQKPTDFWFQITGVVT